MTMHDDLEPTLAEAAAMLAAASVVDVRTDRGESVELWTISSEGQSVAASAPRLSVASGMRLECRLATDEAPLHVWAVIESAEYRSQARAASTARAVLVGWLLLMQPLGFDQTPSDLFLDFARHYRSRT